MNIKDEIFEAYGEMKAEQDLLAVGYTALLGTVGRAPRSDARFTAAKYIAFLTGQNRMRWIK